MPRYKGGLSDRPDFDLITPPIKTRKVSRKTKPDGTREVSHTIEHDTEAKAHTIKALRDSKPRRTAESRNRTLQSRNAFAGDARYERPAPDYSGDPGDEFGTGGDDVAGDAGDAPRQFNQSFPNDLYRAPDEWDADPMRMIGNRTDPMLERIRNISSVDEANQLIHMMRSSRMRSA